MVLVQKLEYNLSAYSNIPYSIFISWNKLDTFSDIKYFEVRCNNSKVHHEITTIKTADKNSVYNVSIINYIYVTMYYYNIYTQYS